MSFDNLNTSGTKNISVFLMVFITAAASLATVFLPITGFVSLAFVPVPAGLLMVLNRVRDAAICIFTGAALFLLFNYVVAIVSGYDKDMDGVT